MRKILYIIILYMPLLLLTACDVHEWPEAPERVSFHLRLNYETEITEWHHSYDGSDVIEQGYGRTYDNHLSSGKIRYVIRAYPISKKQRAAENHIEEFVFTRNISDGYDYGVTLDLPAGSYSIMVWSDLAGSEGDSYFHDASNFAEIRLLEGHVGNTDYRDAFRGTGGIELISDIIEHDPDTLDIAMQRPLAKFELITNDLKDFIEKETARQNALISAEPASHEETKSIDVEKCKVVFYYRGFMHNQFSIFSDKPVDSATGVMFESTAEQLTDNEATLGFDYIFVNGSESAVTMQIGLYNEDGEQLSMTEAIEVPIKRNHHTIITGTFLMSEAMGGVTINPDFDGNHNVIIK